MVMTIEEQKARLRAIVEATDKLTADDKDFVRDCADVYGVDFEPKKTRCKSCYQDAALAVLSVIKANEPAPQHNENAPRYVLRNGVDVYFGGIRVNEHTITDELAERIIARGFEKKFFAKCE